MKNISIAVSVIVLVFGAAILAQTQTESMEQEAMSTDVRNFGAII